MRETGPKFGYSSDDLSKKLNSHLFKVDRHTVNCIGGPDTYQDFLDNMEPGYPILFRYPNWFETEVHVISTELRKEFNHFIS